MASRPRLWAAAVLVSLAASGLLAASSPMGSGRWLPACPFHALTGLYCPGCGSLRALRHLLHGEVLQSLQCNFLLVPVLVLVAVYEVSVLLDPARAVPRAGGKASRFIAVAFLVAMTAFAVMRNLPLHLFDVLRP